jgi:hypothetical protein
MLARRQAMLWLNILFCKFEGIDSSCYGIVIYEVLRF